MTLRASAQYDKENKGWIGVDLDRTLAVYDGWKGLDHIGPPVPKMKKRVINWIAEGKRVKIFTARACEAINIPVIEKWLDDNGFPPLEITCTKDFNCMAIYDDIARQVVPNTGEVVKSK